MNPNGGLNESKIEQLKKSLYSRTDRARGVIRRARLSRGTENVQLNWGTQDNLGLKSDVLTADTIPQGSSFFKKVFFNYFFPCRMKHLCIK